MPTARGKALKQESASSKLEAGNTPVPIAMGGNNAHADNETKVADNASVNSDSTFNTPDFEDHDPPDKSPTVRDLSREMNVVWTKIEHYDWDVKTNSVSTSTITIVRFKIMYIFSINTNL